MCYPTLFLVCLLLQPGFAAEPTVFNIPRLDGIEIDGNPDDWRDRGFRIEIMAGENGGIRPLDTFDSRTWLGWNDRGLLVLVMIQDDDLIEEPDFPSGWRTDGVQLFLAANREPNADSIRVLLSPGLAKDSPGFRFKVDDKRAESRRDGEIHVEAARTETEDGYILEALLPWDALAIEPEIGREVAFQIFAQDIDSDGGRLRAVFYPSTGTLNDLSHTHLLRLADEPSPPVVAHGTGDYDRLRFARITVNAVSELAGKTARVLHDGQSLGEGTFDESNGRAALTARIPMPPVEQDYGPLAVEVDGRDVATVELPSAIRQRAWAMLEEQIIPSPSVFHGDDFPTVDFVNPDCVERLLGGTYEIDTTFYDAQHNVVGKPENPGRYGAIIRITTPDGRTLTRYRTIYRIPEPYEPWRSQLKAQIDLPPQFGVDPDVAAKWSDKVNDQYKWSFVSSSERSQWNAILLAGLSEMQLSDPEPASEYNSPWIRDRAWWLELKRRLNGNAERFSRPFPGPRIANDSPPAPVLREGTMPEAGMHPDAREKIDALLTEWANDTDEAFIACIARNGVIVLHKAYGARNGKPMTVDTPSYMASLSKLIAGTQIMMLVDQGFIDLDAPIDSYLPELQGAAFSTMPTMRHLFTHTAGLESHRGEDDHDLEHLVAEFAPHLKVGGQYQYNGMSMELGTKVLEQVAGQTYPDFALHHLLTPLGCEHTAALNPGFNTQSTAIDMARIGQMLLNRGSYGEDQFMRPETFEQMLPQQLTKVLGPNASRVYGIGCAWYENEPGLSSRTLGHGAASNATLRIDLENNLIISMTRNAAGENFNKYHPRLIELVASLMVEAEPVTQTGE